jgi:uncharacterized repeat protein (TIGR01451 family)
MLKNLVRSIRLVTGLALTSFALCTTTPAHAVPTLRAPLTVALQADVDNSGSITCGDRLRYTLSIQPQTEVGTDLQNVAFDIVPGTNLLFDPASVVAVNSNQTVHVVADPLSIHVDFGRVCNSTGCPGPPLSLVFDGQIRVVNTGSAVSIQGQVSGSNIKNTATDGTPNASIDPTVSPYPPCPPMRSVRATKTYTLIDDRDHDGAVDPGDAIRYTVQIQSTSAGVGVNAVRFDSGVDPNSSLVVGSVTTSRGTVLLGNGTGNSTVRVQVGDLAPNGSATITFDARVATPFPLQAGSISCQGTVTSTTGDISPTLTDDPTTVAANDPTRTAIDFDPDLALTKRDGGALAVPGQIVIYALGVSNLSPRQGAVGVTLSEVVPASATFSPKGSSSGWNCLGRNCTLSVGNVAASGALSRTFAIRIDESLPAGTSGFDNTAHVADDGTNGPEPSLKNNTASDSTPLDRTRARPDLSVTKDDGGAHVQPGAIVTYALRTANLGPLGASGVVLRETVPTHSTFTTRGSSPGWSCAEGSPSGTECTLLLGVLNGGGTGSSPTATFTVRAASHFPVGVSSLSNTVRIDDDGMNGPDADPANNTASDSTPLDGVAPNLKLAKRLDPSSGHRPGDRVVWHLLWENSGNQDAAGVVLSDPIPPYMTFDAKASSPGWVCAPGAATQTVCTLSIGTVGAGSGGDAHLALRIDSPFPAGVEVLTNCAELGNLIVRATTACSDVSIVATPDLVLTKSDGGISTRPGLTVAYVLRYENRGDQGTRGVGIEETLPEHTTFAPAGSTPGWSCADRTCKLGVPDLPVGASSSVTFAVRVDAKVPAGVAQIVNTALIRDDGQSGADPNPADNLASDVTPLVDGGPPPSAQLMAAKRDGLTVDHGAPGLADVGDHIRYEVLINNLGTGTAMDLVFRTGVDPRTTIVPGSVTVDASQAVIVRGNDPGDDSIEIRIASLAANRAVYFTFEVEVGALGTGPIRCQGEVLSGNAPRIVTDDPDTSIADDPTLTPIAGPPGPAVDIPTLGEFGFGVLVFLILGSAFPSLRRLEIPSIGKR